MIGPYGTPQAFRAALEARLRNIAQSRGTDLQRLRRRLAFERLLARLFAQGDPPWLLKGGYLKEERTGAPGGGVCCSIEARLAGRTFARFHLDVGLGDVVLGQPDWVEGNTLLSFAGIPAARAALYPADQQFAEKIHSYTFPWRDRDNTRVKDLVDLVLLVDLGLLEPNRVKRALRVTFETRGTHPLPGCPPEPPPAWARPYAALARELGLPALTLEEAHAYLDACWQRWGLSQIGESDR